MAIASYKQARGSAVLNGSERASYQPVFLVIYEVRAFAWLSTGHHTLDIIGG